MTQTVSRWPDNVIPSTFRIPIQVNEPTGQPTDITGWQFRIVVQDELDGSDDDKVYEQTHVVGDGAKDKPTLGFCEPVISSTDMATMTPGNKYVLVERSIPGTDPLDIRILGPFPWRLHSAN